MPGAWCPSLQWQARKASTHRWSRFSNLQTSGLQLCVMTVHNGFSCHSFLSNKYVSTIVLQALSSTFLQIVVFKNLHNLCIYNPLFGDLFCVFLTCCNISIVLDISYQLLLIVFVIMYKILFQKTFWKIIGEMKCPKRGNRKQRKRVLQISKYNKHNESWFI